MNAPLGLREDPIAFACSERQLVHQTDMPPQSPHACYRGMNGQLRRGPSGHETG
jgi:hypothetical protein